MNISSLFLSVSLALLMKAISGYEEIIKTDEDFRVDTSDRHQYVGSPDEFRVDTSDRYQYVGSPDEFRVDTSDKHQYVGSPDTRNNGWDTDVSDEKDYDKKTSNGGDDGRKNEIVVRKTTNDAQNQDDVKAFPKMTNCNGIGSINNRHGGRASAKETFQENKLKLDGNTKNESDIGSYSRTKLWKRAVKLSVNNGLWTLSHMLAKTAKNKNKMAAMRKPKVVKMKLKSSMLYRLLSRNIGHNNVLLRFWLLKVGR